MEQVEGGDLVVNRGDESKPKDSPDSVRELNVVDGYEAALKLAQVTHQHPKWLPFSTLSLGQFGRTDQESNWGSQKGINTR